MRELPGVVKVEVRKLETAQYRVEKDISPSSEADRTYAHFGIPIFFRSQRCALQGRCAYPFRGRPANHHPAVFT